MEEQQRTAEAEDGRIFVTKWATGANPVRTEIIKDGENLKPLLVVEASLVDQAEVLSTSDREMKGFWM